MKSAHHHDSRICRPTADPRATTFRTGHPALDRRV
jgi:hypothetical protein